MCDCGANRWQARWALPESSSDEVEAEVYPTERTPIAVVAAMIEMGCPAASGNAPASEETPIAVAHRCLHLQWRYGGLPGEQPLMALPCCSSDDAAGYRV